MTASVVLASASPIRKRLLEAAGVILDVRPAMIDEETVRQSLQAENVTSMEMATSLAELKARRISRSSDQHLTIGCDQILEFEGEICSKSRRHEDARLLLRRLRGKSHSLYAAAVICEQGTPVWRSVSSARVTMRSYSDAYLESYLHRGGENLRGSVGCYHIEEEGIRMIAELSGDIYAVYGLPMIALLGYLIDRGILDS